MKDKKECVCRLMDFVDESCHWIRTPMQDITADVNLEFGFVKKKKVCSFSYKFKSIMFSLSKSGMFGEVNVFCFSEDGMNDIYVKGVKFFRLSSFGLKTRRFFKKYKKLYEEQEWIISSVSVRDLLSKLAFCPGWVSKPGETIEDCLEEKNKTIKDLCTHLNRSEVFVHKLIEGEYAISPIIAMGLGSFFGNSAQFWFAREFHYREGLKKLKEKESD